MKQQARWGTVFAAGALRQQISHFGGDDPEPNKLGVSCHDN